MRKLQGGHPGAFPTQSPQEIMTVVAATSGLWHGARTGVPVPNTAPTRVKRVNPSCKGTPATEVQAQAAFLHEVAPGAKRSSGRAGPGCSTAWIAQSDVRLERIALLLEDTVGATYAHLLSFTLRCSSGALR